MKLKKPPITMDDPWAENRMPCASYVYLLKKRGMIRKIHQMVCRTFEQSANERLLMYTLVISTFTTAVIDTDKNRYLAAGTQDSGKRLIVVLKKQKAPFVLTTEDSGPDSSFHQIQRFPIRTEVIADLLPKPLAGIRISWIVVGKNEYGGIQLHNRR